MREGQFRLMTESFSAVAPSSKPWQFILMQEGGAERGTGQVNPHASGGATSQPS